MGRQGRMARESVRDEAARDELVLAYLDVPPQAVGSLWRGHPGVRQLGWDDAVQVGYLGLLRAASLWSGEEEFRPYAYVSCRGYVELAARRGVPLGPRQGPWNLVPHLSLLTERRSRIIPARPEVDQPEPSSRWLRLLAVLPDGLEKKYLEARASGLTCFEAAAACGHPPHHWESLNARAFRMARELGKEHAA